MASRLSSVSMPEIAESTESLMHPAQEPPDQSKVRRSKIINVLVGVLLFSIVATCMVLSKLSLISLLSKLNETMRSSETQRNEAAGLSWQLLFVILIPHVLTFVRAVFFGVCGKQSRTFPWPTPRAIITGAVASVFEVAAMTVAVFYVLPRLPSMVAILALGGVFTVQALVDFAYLETRSPCIRNTMYINLDHHDPSTCHLREGRSCFASCKKRGTLLVENKFSRMIAFLVQLVFIIVLAVFAAQQCAPEDSVLVGCGAGISLFVLSGVWSSKVLQERNRASKKADRTPRTDIIRGKDLQLPTARFKASFINSSLHIVLYILASFFLCLDKRIDPWCLRNNANCTLSKVFEWQNDYSLHLFLIQVLSSFFGYTFVWISCTMMFHRWGLALPTYLCTPLSVGVCAIVLEYHPGVFSFSALTGQSLTVGMLAGAGAMLWIGQMMVMGVFIWRKENLLLAKDGDMFITPHYDGVFLEQHLMLNRQVSKGKKSRGTVAPTVNRLRPRTIFICSTMYHEDSDEMKQMLSSIYDLACFYQRKKENDHTYRDHFESHIFLDGGSNGTQLTFFALQLFSLFEETLHVDPKVLQRIDTPYGSQLSCHIVDAMPIYVHLKDSYKVKNKKRWSQVMYMNYVLNYRVKRNIRNLGSRNVQELKQDGGSWDEENKMDDDNTFILTTDADIQFTPESAIVLLDRLDSDPQVGAVCARTHPQGSGPLYWYQVFDYAIGHWFQKAAEDIMGTVLCCPGCFSIFRCRALRSVLDTYSTEVTSASEFLTKDMGEDRWLCTLLVEKGWRLSYCAISENYTHCPESMDEFFKQRRRWIPSTVANLSLLISHASKITRGNDRISILFVIFEGIMVFSTAISPATVIMVIAAGFTAAFQVNPVAVIVPLLIFCLFYGLLCMYGDAQFQLDVAQACTLLFSLLMGVVVVGYIANVEQDVLNVTQVFINYSHSGAQGPLPTFLQPSTIYLFIYALVFVLAAALHPSEWTCLFHFVWYLIALPSGYLVLLIYSAANLDNRSWGTREGSTGGQVGVYKSIANFAQKVWARLVLCTEQCTCRPVIPPHKAKTPPPPLDEETSFDQQKANQFEALVDRSVFQLTPAVQSWLAELDCGQYGPNFEENGYFTLYLIADMKSEDFEAIGIPERGHKLRLEREARRLSWLPIETAIPDDVSDWLQKLELEGYIRLFSACGYSTKDDLESVKGLTVEDLKKMGICMRAHQKRLLQGTKRLSYPSAVEVSISQSKNIIENASRQVVEDEDEEKRFWLDLIRTTLEPMKASFITDTDLKQKLRSLRNTVLCVMLLINVMWIVLLSSLRIPISEHYKIPDQTLTLLFLFIYTAVLVVQFLAMLVHRCITLVHYLARVGPDEETEY